MTKSMMEVKNLTKFFKTSRGLLHAVDDISFNINAGQTLGLVGESGCGKSTTGRAILRLVEPTSGQVLFNGTDLLKYGESDLRKVRKEMQIIFQDPFSSLDPRKSVHQIISEPMEIHRLYPNRKEREDKTRELMATVGLADRLYNAYPHQLDGGRRQRIGIARALSVNPKLIVCDEPVSALDVSIQAQILNLLEDLQEKLDLTYLFITHDLSVVYHFSDEIAVMYLGKLVEKATAEEMFAHPMHPYTTALLSAIPIPDLQAKRKRIILKGEVSSPINMPDECRFAPRCQYARAECRQGSPELVELTPNHFVACKFPLL